MFFRAESISKSILAAFSAFGGAIPFSVLEWGLAALLLRILLRPQRLRRLFALILTMLLAFELIWVPLYAEAVPVPASGDVQIRRLCVRLIEQLNAAETDFQAIPDDLPAKHCAFPFWMRALKLSGFYSFFTGEALISPDLPPCAVPFTAVHEAMHGRGIADEGACNIAAYEECVSLGGAYADSARLWALRYALGRLKNNDFDAYYALLNRMKPALFKAFREIGGAIPPQSGSYGILADYLAAREHV